MRKILINLILTILVIIACTPQTPTEPPSIFINDPARPTRPVSTATPVSSGKPLSPLEKMVVEQLAKNLGLQINAISVVSNKSFEFGDSCLGMTMPDLMCAQVVTPGRIIVLEADGVKYEYHTNVDGSHAVPATLALTWKREGGIAGFCDNLAVFLSGEVYGSQCNTDDGRMQTFSTLLSATEQRQFNSWIAKYGQVDLDASDPKGVADGMTVLLSLYGNGNSQPSKDDNAAMFLWAQDLFQKLYK